MKRLRLDLWHRDLWQWVLRWLTHEGPPHEIPLYDFPRLSEALRPGDVVLVEGRTRIAGVIRLITQSQWSHSALYVGRLTDIEDHSLRHLVAQYYQDDHGEQLLIEALVGEGTRVSPLGRYRNDHLRVCRPRGLCPDDAQQVLAYAIRRLGSDYDVRQLLDLARFFFPWAVLPRRWRSTLFEHGSSTTRIVCSRLLAEAFDTVGYPILPFMERRSDGSLHFFRRNPRLFTPRDFDYSPFFEVLKFPPAGLADPGVYRSLTWSLTHLVYSDSGPGYRAALSFAWTTTPPESASEAGGATDGTDRPGRIREVDSDRLLPAPTRGSTT